MQAIFCGSAPGVGCSPRGVRASCQGAKGRPGVDTAGMSLILILILITVYSCPSCCAVEAFCLLPGAGIRRRASAGERGESYFSCLSVAAHLLRHRGPAFRHIVLLGRDILEPGRRWPVSDAAR